MRKMPGRAGKKQEHLKARGSLGSEPQRGGQRSALDMWWWRRELPVWSNLEVILMRLGGGRSLDLLWQKSGLHRWCGKRQLFCKQLCSRVYTATEERGGMALM
jgi:hypothetical protein